MLWQMKDSYAPKKDSAIKYIYDDPNRLIFKLAVLNWNKELFFFSLTFVLITQMATNLPQTGVMKTHNWRYDHVTIRVNIAFT